MLLPRYFCHVFVFQLFLLQKYVSTNLSMLTIFCVICTLFKIELGQCSMVKL